jgi:hypothetical protein
MFKLLSFDVYGTLVNTPPTNERGFGSFSKRPVRRASMP